MPSVQPILAIAFCALAIPSQGAALRHANSTRREGAKTRSSFSGPVGCRDDDGNPVDYWYALKVPKLTNYGYSDANGGAFAMSANDMASAHDGALAATLQQIYAGTDGVGYALYNDETPDKHKEGSRAHSKGVMGFGQGGGFWLVHSSPCFPDYIKNGYAGFGQGVNPSSTKYGQSFLCLSLSLDELDGVASNMMINWPHVHDSSVPDALSGALPNVTAWLANQHVTDPTATMREVRTQGGATFHAFAKNKQWNKQLYEDLVAPTLRMDLETETWQNGVGNMPSYCKAAGYAYDVENIQNVQIHGEGGVGWKHTQDHSKWAVGINGAKVACIGDINRQVSQRTRGGGTVCSTSDSNFISSMQGVVATTDSC